MTMQRNYITPTPGGHECFPQNRTCPVCGKACAGLLHTQDLVLPEEFELLERFHVVICASCGMAYSDTIGHSGQLTAHYRADSYTMCNWEHHNPEVYREDVLGAPVDVERLRVLVEELGELLPDRDVRILDVGCASGTLLALLSGAGFSDVQGIDPSANAVSAAHRIGQRARVGDVDAPLPPDLGTFDVIIISHVLEHLDRPREALQNLRRVLRPGGQIYAEVPDAARYAEFLVEPFVDFNHEHVNHFSMVHLHELFRAGGFAIAASGKKTIIVINWPYPVIYGLWRMLEVTPAEGIPATLDVNSLRRSLSPYVAGSRELLEKYDVILKAKLRGRREVAVRCLGYRAWTLLANTILRDLSIIAYIDHAPAKQALTVRRSRICAPEAPLAPGIPIIVLAYHVEAAIVEEYAQLDPAREVITVGRLQPVSTNGASDIDNDMVAGYVC